MNRIIKFRVWDKQNNEMVQWADVRETELLDDAFDGKDAVAMQFTGLKDKKEWEIYEGDILQVKICDDIIPANNRKAMATVEWSDLYGAWRVRCSQGDSYYFGLKENCWVDNGNCKVVGNVFQNPELLNVKTN
jgi:uncharacterized phage protein (TIGR01671 family)